MCALVSNSADSAWSPGAPGSRLCITNAGRRQIRVPAVTRKTMMTGPSPPQTLVSTDWLASRLADPAIRVVEVNEDILLYGRGHIVAVCHCDVMRTGREHPLPWNSLTTRRQIACPRTASAPQATQPQDLLPHPTEIDHPPGAVDGQPTARTRTHLKGMDSRAISTDEREPGRSDALRRTGTEGADASAAPDAVDSQHQASDGGMV